MGTCRTQKITTFTIMHFTLLTLKLIISTKLHQKHTHTQTYFDCLVCQQIQRRY